MPHQLFSSFDPATGQLIWQGYESVESDVNKAVKSAQRAFPSWSKLHLEERVNYLNLFSEILLKESSHLATIISKETGKPLWESNNEVTSMISKVAISIEAYNDRCGTKAQEISQGELITRHKPHGVVAVFGPFNFPGHLPTGHIVPALLAGNTVIFKPSEFTPLVGEEIIKCWKKCNLPEGVLNLVQGGSKTGQILGNHPQINGLFFTGSFNTGKQLAELYSTQPQKILALELGGNNPYLVASISNIRAAAQLTVKSAYITSGQRCTCARRLIIVESAQSDSFIQTLIDLTQEIKIGPYTDIPEPFMGPLINEQHALNLLSVQSKLTALGGKPLIEMKHLQKGTGFISPGLIDVTGIKQRPDEEYFGPFLQLIRVNNFQEALIEANNTKYGLAAGILTDLQEEYAEFYESVRAGVVNWNVPLTGASSAAPFGGIGCSGNHRPGAYYAADYCSYPVSSIESPKIRLGD